MEKRAQHEMKEVAPKMKVYVTLAVQIEIPHLEHRVGRREMYGSEQGAWYKYRKRLIQKFRLKGLRWNLWERDGIAWVCLPKLPRIEDGAELKLEVY
jgi:hypothetical protein